MFKKRTELKSFFYIDLLFMLFFIGAVIIKSFYFQFTTRLNVRPFLTAENIYMLISSFGVLLIVFAICFLTFNKKRKKALFVLSIFLSLIFISNTLYFRYYYNAITIPVLLQIGLVGSVGDSVKSLFRIKDIIYIIDIPIMLSVILYVKKANLGTYKVGFLKRAILSIVIIVLGITAIQIPYHRVDTTTFQYDSNYVVRRLGLFYFNYYDVRKFVRENLFEDKNLSAEEIASIENLYESLPDGGDRYEGIARDKNLIIVQVEALQEFVINTEWNGQEITPFLNQYINESVYFDNLYYQIGGGNTSDSEFLTNVSLYPVVAGAVYFRFPYNTYYSMPKILQERGYKSYITHAFNPSFWNRTEMYKAIGYDYFYSNRDFELDEIVGWGLSDSSMFRQSLEKMDTSEPFYWFPVTLSSHHPFNFFDDYEGFDPGEFNDTFIGDYLKACHYVDNSLKELIQELKDQDLYDNSILLIYGDHGAVQKEHVEMLEKLLSKEINDFEWLKLQKVPLFIKVPSIKETGINNTIGGQIDIMPTIANLMDFDVPYALGKDLFNTQSGYAVLRNSSVITEEYIYINSINQTFDEEGNSIDTEKYIDEIKSFHNHLNISDLILRKDALR